jgi:hypothetical protein
MTDHARREKLAARAKDLRRKADSLISQCKDAGARLLVKSHVLNWVDDIEGFFLEHGTGDTHGLEAHWLLGAERIMTSAEKSYESLVEQFTVHGGPAMVRIIGG